MGTLDKADKIIKSTIKKIKNNEVEISRITRTVLVIDEAQDMDVDEFELIKMLMDKNDEMRVIAVGDDDQNIYEWRGAESKYLLSFITEKKATKYELITNYRSKSNLVSFTNQFVKTIGVRLKENPIQAKQTDNGKIKIVHYTNGNLITPLIDDILSTGLSGTTCILTYKNDEAFKVAGLLTKKGLKAKLIQSNDNFSLYNLAEVRFFLDELNLGNDVLTISEEAWNNAKRKVKDRYKLSSKFEICDNLINVFLLLENFDVTVDERKRQLYVAMTRAKQKLIIHLNGDYLDKIKAEELERVENNNTFQPPDSLTLHLSHKDLNLGYFEYIQKRVNELTSVDPLVISDEGCSNEKGELVLKFSKKFLNRLTEIKKNGFELKEAKVNFIVHWQAEDKEQDVKIILPELRFDIKQSNIL